MIKKITDEELVFRVLNKNKECFSEIVSRYQDKLLRYIYRITSASEFEAKEVLQDSFVKVYKNLNDFDLNLKFSSWIYRIVHNEVRSWYRQKTTKGKNLIIDVDDSVLQNISDDLFDITARVENSISAEFIQKSLVKINKKYQEIIILRYFENKDYKEISDILKRPINTIATQLSRAKKQLRKEINNLTDGIYEKK